MNTTRTDPVKQQVARHWDRRAAHFDEDFGHSITTPGERAAWDRILDLVVPGGGPIDALDAGCGTGFLSLELAARGHRVTGVDFAPAMLTAARSKAAAQGLAIRFEEGDAENLLFPPDSFDLAISRHVLWTLPHPEAAIDEWLRVLRPGGRLAIVDGAQYNDATAPPQRENARTSSEYAAIGEQLPFYGGRPQAEIEALLRAHGLVNVAGDPLRDLVDAQMARMVAAGGEPRPRQRYVVWGDIPRLKEKPMSYKYEHILVDIEDGVGVITLNRPEKLNAMNRRLGSELQDAVRRLDDDDACGCIVLTGAGRAFSAGGDIHEQLEDDAKFSDEELDRMRTRRGYLDVSISKKPIIGMMNGLAYGGAAVVASALDMRIGCEHTKFRFLAAAYGRINSTWTLPNQVGWPMAKELLFSARVVEAEEAYRIGLLNHLVPQDQLRAKTMELAKTIAGNNRAAVIGIKQLLLKQMTESVEEQWDEERRFTTEVMRNAKAKEAFPEFIAKKGIQVA